MDAMLATEENATPGVAVSPTEALGDEAAATPWALAEKTLSERGIKRFVSPIFAISGGVIFSGKKVKVIRLNPLYPRIDRIRTAREAFLKPYHIQVLLDKI
jgi:hypothetical protein